MAPTPAGETPGDRGGAEESSMETPAPRERPEGAPSPCPKRLGWEERPGSCRGFQGGHRSQRRRRGPQAQAAPGWHPRVQRGPRGHLVQPLLEEESAPGSPDQGWTGLCLKTAREEKRPPPRQPSPQLSKGIRQGNGGGEPSPSKAVNIWVQWEVRWQPRGKGSASLCVLWDLQRSWLASLWGRILPQTSPWSDGSFSVCSSDLHTSLPPPWE